MSSNSPPGATVRSCSSRQQQKAVRYEVPVIHPGGRLVAVAMSDGVRLFDLETGAELADLPQSRYTIAVQADGAFLTNGDHGLLRWTLRRHDSDLWQLGPPQVLASGSFFNLASDKTGDLIAQATGNGAMLVRPGKGALFLAPHAGSKNVAVSPDGKYVATGINDGEDGVKVWDTETQRPEITFFMGRFCEGTVQSGWPVAGGARRPRLPGVKVGTWEKAFEDHWNFLAGLLRPMAHCWQPDYPRASFAYSKRPRANWPVWKIRIELSAPALLLPMALNC